MNDEERLESVREQLRASRDEVMDLRKLRDSLSQQVFAVRKRNGELLAMLRELEWAGTAPDPYGGGFNEAICPSCGYDKNPDANEHKPDCRLASLLVECGT